MGRETVVFPYANLSEAVRDKFRLIGGPDQAWRFLVKGFKEITWRRRTNKALREREKEEDREFFRNQINRIEKGE
jgi:hypothetical protein